MSYTEKGTVEGFIIQELQGRLGWKYVDPEEMKLRRKEGFEEPLIVEDLKNALKRINKNVELTDADLSFIVTSLRTIPASLEGIRMFLDKFRNGIVVPLQRERKERVVKLVDLENLENNDFVVTNQFRIEGLKGNIRADVVLLVNGIPLVLIECKNPTLERVDWTDAYRQIKRYEDQAPEVFKYVQFSIATDGIKTYYFPNAFRSEGEERNFLAVWKDPYPFKKEGFRKDDTLRIAVHGLLSKQNLLDIVGNFIFIRKEGDRLTKVMSRYMQFRASNKIFNRVVSTLRGKERKKFGLIWHWQGSGKTYTMAFSAWKLLHCPEAGNPSIFVMVDRRDLEEQIEKDFAFIGVPIEKIGSIRELIEVLRWGREGKRGIFLVTVEKFSPKEFDELRKGGKKIEIKRENVVVFADEVHRTQYRKFATIWRSVLRNAFVFGFTGTPLSKADRNTFQRFCPEGELYLDRYSMLDALEDGFTVPLSYQASLPEYHLKKEQLEEFIRFEEAEIKTLSEEEQKAVRRRINVIKAFVKNPDRVKAVVENVMSHFRDVVEPTGLNALIVTIDREACVLYKRAIDSLLPPEYSEVVMTSSVNDRGILKEYFDEIQAKYKTGDVKEIHQRIIDSFKTGRGPRILIVTDMLITGFDSPNLWTMYLDKPLKEHRLLQAIARTNRPFLNKKFGLIVDYIGVLAELEKAFEKFEAGDAKDLRLVIRDLSREREVFEKQIRKALGLFDGVKREDTNESLESALNMLIDPEKARVFEETMRSLMRSYEMLSGYPFLREYLFDYTWLSKVYVAYYKRFKKIYVDELKIEDISRKTVSLIQKTVDVSKIEEVCPTVTIDEEYIALLRKSPPKKMGAAIDVITAIMRECGRHPTSPFFINLSKDVERVYDDMRNRRMEVEEAMKRILGFSEQIVRWKKKESEIGREKYPVYEALKNIIPEIEDQRALAFIDRLLNSLEDRKLLFKGWQQQREVRRRIMAETRFLLLSEFKDYRDKVDALTERVFEALEGVEWPQ
jgi:type I restriction enzyme R subunit